MSTVQRTISMPVLLAGLIFIAVFFCACSDKIKTDINVFKALDEGLIISNRVIQNGSEEIYHSLENKLYDPPTNEKAKIWYPKAQLIQKLSKDIYMYIEGLKSDLKKEAGVKIEESAESFREADKNAVIRLFDRNGKGEELYSRLKNYKKDVLAIDSQLASVFINTIQTTALSFDSTKNNQQDFTKTFFDDIPTVAALAMLSGFQNNIRVTENNMVSFCSNQIVYHGDSFGDFYSPFIFQNSSYVRAGEEVEIIAGIGAFSRAALPEIKINGRNVKLDYGGAAIQKINASNKPGKHIVPVEISYTDQDGKKQWVIKNIVYTVAQE